MINGDWEEEKPNYAMIIEVQKEQFELYELYKACVTASFRYSKMEEMLLEEVRELQSIDEGLGAQDAIKILSKAALYLATEASSCVEHVDFDEYEELERKFPAGAIVPIFRAH